MPAPAFNNSSRKACEISGTCWEISGTSWKLSGAYRWRGRLRLAIRFPARLCRLQPKGRKNLLNDKRFQPDNDDFYHDYAILNVDHPERSLDYLRFVFVELPKFKPRNVLEKKMAVLWLRFLTEINENTDEVPAELLENEQIRRALSIVEKSAMTEGQLYVYERFGDQVNREHVLAEGNFNDGLAIGEAKGRAEGRAEGIRNEKLENARKMKQLGIDISTISQVTGLSVEEIEALWHFRKGK